MNKQEPMLSSRHPRHLFPEPRLARLQLQCHHQEEGEDDLQAAARDQELTDLAEEGDEWVEDVDDLPRETGEAMMMMRTSMRD